MESNNQQQQYQQHSFETQYPQHSLNQHYPPNPPPVSNGSAIAALVLGILAVCIPYIGFFIGIIAIVIGYRAYKRIPPYTPGGTRGMAIAGLVCGIVGVSIYGFIFLILLFALLAV